jgi:hypothetical protein
MWDEDQDGTEEDYAVQRALIDELRHRCLKLLRIEGKQEHVDYGPGVITVCRVGPVTIKWAEDRDLWVDVFIPGESQLNGDRAYTENKGVGGYINRYRVREIVLPYLRQVMILDDIVDAVEGSPGDGQVSDGEG